MELNRQFDRCCNPFGLENHLRKSGLRQASVNIKKTLGLSDFYLLCSGCRKKATAIIKQQKNVINDNNDNYLSNNENKCDSDIDATDTQQSFRSLSFDSELALSQSSSSSQISAETQLPIINKAFQWLNESPISSKT
ncbi:hypothetical protein ABEB36_001610 [Hypothenemus hampei]|uniref:Uncharacterized protein n=1 Tax=Hypothenemus hampei TaxID=57062 RepID=A0ABD1FG47_HYPHA